MLLGLPGLLSRYSDSLQAGRFRFASPGGGAIFRTLPDQHLGPSAKWVLVPFTGGKAPGSWRWLSTPI
jgi:hypothetical protein